MAARPASDSSKPGNAPASSWIPAVDMATRRRHRQRCQRRQTSRMKFGKRQRPSETEAAFLMPGRKKFQGRQAMLEFSLRQFPSSLFIQNVADGEGADDFAGAFEEFADFCHCVAGVIEGNDK